MIPWQSVSWEAWLVAVPLVAAVLAFVLVRRGLPWLPLLTVAAVIFLLAGLSAAIGLDGPRRLALAGWGAPLGIDLYADGLSLVMLWLTGGTGALVSLYALSSFRDDTDKAAAFWPLWLVLWSALNALFLSADIFNLYVTLELLTLAAIPLVALAGGARALAAAMRYLLFALLGSLAYLLGVTLLYGGYGSLDIAQLGGLVAPEPAAWLAIALITVGLLVKSAVFPLHVWLAPAHSSAPAPVSAVLSALVVKASFYLLVRLWFWVFPTALTPEAGQVLGVLGAAAIVYGSVQALRQVRLKLLVAYSTVAQLGYLLLLFPLAGAAAWTGAMYQALSHGFAKSALFLAAGNVIHVLGHDRIAELGGATGHRLSVTLFAFALAGVSIMGLPPSGGFLAKWLLLEASLETGQWWWAAVILGGGLLAAAYVFRVLAHAFGAPPAAAATTAARELPAAMALVPLALAFIALGLGFAGMPLTGALAVGTPFPATEPAP